jgi:prophage regulatory protein
MTNLPENPIIERLQGLLLLRKAKVLEITGLNHSALYREIEAGRFPAAVQLTPGTVAWRASDIEAWAKGLAVADPAKSRRKRERKAEIGGAA